MPSGVWAPCQPLPAAHTHQMLNHLLFRFHDFTHLTTNFQTFFMRALSDLPTSVLQKQKGRAEHYALQFLQILKLMMHSKLPWTSSEEIRKKKQRHFHHLEFLCPTCPICNNNCSYTSGLYLHTEHITPSGAWSRQCYAFSFAVNNSRGAFMSNLFQIQWNVFCFWKLPLRPHRTNSSLLNETKVKAWVLTNKNVPENPNSGEHISLN